jgi:hypothetical protein
MRALALAGILGVFGLAAIFALRDGGRGYHVYYLSSDGSLEVSSSQRHSQLRHR